jgi:hypothetical protein
MRVSTYVRGIRLAGRSPLPPEECARRINAATASAIGSAAGVPVGRVTRRGHLRLQKSRSILIGYGAKPVLTGDLWPDKGGTRFELRYGGHFLDLSAFGCWFLFALLFAGLLIAGVPTGHVSGETLLAGAGALAFVVGSFWVTHLFGTRNAMAELDELLRFLEREAEASFDPGWRSAE